MKLWKKKKWICWLGFAEQHFIWFSFFILYIINLIQRLKSDFIAVCVGYENYSAFESCQKDGIYELNTWKPPQCRNYELSSSWVYEVRKHVWWCSVCIHGKFVEIKMFSCTIQLTFTYKIQNYFRVMIKYLMIYYSIIINYKNTPDVRFIIRNFIEIELKTFCWIFCRNATLSSRSDQSDLNKPDVVITTSQLINMIFPGGLDHTFTQKHHLEISVSLNLKIDSAHNFHKGA